MSKKEKSVQVKIGDQLPRRGHFFSRGLMALIIALIGWKIKGAIPNVPQIVFVGAPHTSNGEGIMTVLMTMAMGIQVSWMTKHTLFKRPFGTFVRWAGGVPVYRDASHGTVAQMVQLFDKEEKMLLAIMPEGTRDHVRHWKKGFYYIAEGADAPIVPVIFDYANKEVRFDPVFNISGDYEVDLPLIKAIFEGVVPRHPERL